MLDRIDMVKNVGLFADHQHSSECAFGEVTLIFGENGTGKSTIAAILDSLRERNPAEIARRTRLPGEMAPMAAITLHGNTYHFDGTQWDNQPPYDTIDVFYPGFVSRNVHSATSVESDQRRRLCELVLGREAVKKATRLAEVDEQARQALQERKRLDADIRLLVKQPDTLETYLALRENTLVDQQLDDARSELREARDKAAIMARPMPQPVSLPDVDAAAICRTLEKSLANVVENVAEAVQDHVRLHLDSDGETWLAYGAEHVESNLCPFCGQDLAGSGIARAIRSYFGAEYRAYSDTLFSEIRALRTGLGLAAFPPIRAAIAGQAAVAARWLEEADQVAVDAEIGEAGAAWERAATKLEELLAGKQAHPLICIESLRAKDSLEDYRRSLGILDTMNRRFIDIRERAEQRKKALATVRDSDIEERISHLENEKARFEPLSMDLICRRNMAIEKRSGLDRERNDLKKEIDEHAARVIGKYQNGINHYLEYFGCDIRIESIEAGFPSGKVSVQYKLKAHGFEIPLGCCEDSPCFETVLSDGDKYTLALSFFVARLQGIEDLSGRVVVLDDPVNSLGNARRGLVEGIVRDLRRRKAQVVVLTHDERLAALMWRDSRLNKDMVCLQVRRAGKVSRLSAWDVEKATRTEYVKDYLTLAQFLDDGMGHEKAARCIRPYVEQRLRHLFPGPPFESRDSLGIMVGKIRDSEPGSRVSCLKGNKLTVLESINDSSLPSHHATDDVPGWQSPSPEEVRIFAQKALSVLD